MVISEFQLALIGAGTAAVMGVWAYNSWQERRQRKAAEIIFRGTQQDVLVEELPTEDAAVETPALVRAPEVHANECTDSRIEPVFTLPQGERIGETVTADETQSAAAPVAPLAPPSPAALMPDAPGEEFIDSMIEIGFALPPEPSVAVLQAAWREVNIDCRKRIRWIGRDTNNGKWVEVDDLWASTTDHANVNIQLADRQGAIDRDELSAFCHAAAAIATLHGRQLDIPALDEIIAHARSIDDFCASVDIQIAIHIVGRTGQAFAGTKLRGLLEVSGLQLAADGLFYQLDEEGGRRFSVCNSGAVPFDLEQMRTGTIPDITFWLDVPRVSNGGAVFDTMLATARQLADALDGVLVDDQRNPLADNMLATIRAKVVELQAQMATRGIPAGGRRALRLFS